MSEHHHQGTKEALSIAWDVETHIQKRLDSLNYDKKNMPDTLARLLIPLRDELITAKNQIQMIRRKQLRQLFKEESEKYRRELRAMGLDYYHNNH